MAVLSLFFFKACTEGYVVNSCLAPPLNPAMSQGKPAALTSYEHLRVQLLCSVTANFKEISKLQEILWGTEYVQTGYLSPFIHNSLGTKLKLPWREGGTKGERERKREGGGKEGSHLYLS